MSFRQTKTSDDEFESADEGEDESNCNLVRDKVSQSKAVTDGWDDWNVDDDGSNEKRRDSISSSSLSSSTKPRSDSQLGSDEGDPIDDLEQQRLQRKKLHKKLNETGTRTSRPLERRDEECSSKSPHQNEAKDAHQLLDRLAAQSPTRVPTWSSPWSNFGSFLSTAKQSVTTLTSTVSEGFSAVIESVEAGLGAPDPQALAEMDRMALKIKGETSDSEEESEMTVMKSDANDSVINQDGWLNALSLDKLTNTGMKMVSGSLDVLETVGKKTFDVSMDPDRFIFGNKKQLNTLKAIHEADPDLQGTRRLLGKQKRTPSINNSREEETPSEDKKNETLTFLHLFQAYQGLAYLEALETLSNQSSVAIQPMRFGNESLFDLISNYFQIDDHELKIRSLAIHDNDEQDIPAIDSLTQKFTAYQSQLRSTVSVDRILEFYQSAHELVEECAWTDTDIDQRTLFNEAMNYLAKLSTAIVEYYHKTGELFLAGCRSLTSFSIDVELLTIYQKQQQDFSYMISGLTNLFARQMKESSSVKSNETNPPCDGKSKQAMFNQLFIQSSSSQTYIDDAYVLLQPIVTQSMLFHRSTLRSGS